MEHQNNVTGSQEFLADGQNQNYLSDNYNSSSAVESDDTDFEQIRAVSSQKNGAVMVRIDSINIDVINTRAPKSGANARDPQTNEQTGGCACGCAAGEGGRIDIPAPSVPHGNIFVRGTVCSHSYGYPPQRKLGDPPQNFTVPASGMVLCHEAPQYYEFDTLTIPSGSFIRAVCTQLTIKARKLIIEPGTIGNGNPYHIEILGDVGAQGSEGAAGTTGATGTAGEDVSCTGAIPHGGHPGRKGSRGYDGNPGGTGGEGKANLPAFLHFGAITASATEQVNTQLVIYTKSGDGGKGGTGGRGGQGGAGGKGGDAKKCVATCVKHPKDGGNGGDGGTGGTGGAGGNGSNGVDIYVYVPINYKQNVIAATEFAQPGKGGDPGGGGLAGVGGSAGHRQCTNGSIEPYGKTGSHGKPGTHGYPGTDGTVHGAPGTIQVVECDDPLNLQNGTATLVAVL